MHSLLDPVSPLNPHRYNSFPEGILLPALSIKSLSYLSLFNFTAIAQKTVKEKKINLALNAYQIENKNTDRLVKYSVHTRHTLVSFKEESIPSLC